MTEKPYQFSMLSNLLDDKNMRALTHPPTNVIVKGDKDHSQKLLHTKG
jgi:hypothetical protein